MSKILPLKNIPRTTGPKKLLESLFCKLGGMIEIFIVIFVWLIIFRNNSILNGFTRGEIVIYFLIGNLISLFIGYFLHRGINHDLINNDSKLLVYKPLKYFVFIAGKSLKQNFLPFVFAVVIDLYALYFILGNISVSTNLFSLSIIFLMITFSFIFEFLLVYLLNFFVFWTIESKNSYVTVLRLKKIVSGNYFPLSFLPASFLSISLVLPFAYSFFVPMQIYLKKISPEIGMFGILIQLFWIFLLYALICFFWHKKQNKNA